MSLFYKIQSIYFAFMILEDEELLIRVRDNIKYIMKSKGIKQGHLSDVTGIHAGRLLTGDCNMTLTTLNKIASFLDVLPDDLLK